MKLPKEAKQEIMEMQLKELATVMIGMKKGVKNAMRYQTDSSLFGEFDIYIVKVDSKETRPVWAGNRDPNKRVL